MTRLEGNVVSEHICICYRENAYQVCKGGQIAGSKSMPADVRHGQGQLCQIGSQITRVNTTPGELAGNHEFVKRILPGDGTRYQQNLRTEKPWIQNPGRRDACPSQGLSNLQGGETNDTRPIREDVGAKTHMCQTSSLR